MTHINKKFVALKLSSFLILKVDYWSKVFHWWLTSYIRERMWTNNKSMKRFLNESKGAMRVDSAKIWLSFRLFIFFYLLLVISFEDASDIFGDFFKAKALHSSVFSLGLIASDQILVKCSHWLIVHGARYKEFIME